MPRSIGGCIDGGGGTLGWLLCPDKRLSARETRRFDS